MEQRKTKCSFAECSNRARDLSSKIQNKKKAFFDSNLQKQIVGLLNVILLAITAETTKALKYF